MMIATTIMALAGPAPATAAPPRETALRAVSSNGDRQFRLAPFRIGIGVGVRPGMQSSFVLSVGVQLFRSERLKLDGMLAVLPAANLWIPGPFRSLVQVDNHYDLLLVTGPRLDIGPTLGWSARIYRQRWNDTGAAVVPVTGLRIHAPLILARRFSWALDVRGLVDLSPVDLVIESREIRRVSPMQVQVAMRFNFGHGRARQAETQ